MDWPFPARLAQAFAGLGAHVEAVVPRASPLRRAAGPARLHAFSFLDPLANLTAAITAASPDLVVPCDDLAADLLWHLGETDATVAPLLRRSLGPRDSYPLLTARNLFLAEAAKLGLAVAENIAIADEAELERAVARLGLPLVVKADGSWGGDGVAIVRDIAAAKSALAGFSQSSRLKGLARALKRREPHLLVRLRFPIPVRLGAQRFVSGHPATSAIACWQGRLLAANHFDVAVSNGTGPATVLARTDCAAMQTAAERLTAHFALSGLYGLDYMRGADGQALLLEINPRATPTSHLALGPGHDLAAALLCAAGHPTPDRPAITGQTRIALFPQELRRDPQSPHLAGAYHDLPLGDPALLKALLPKGRALTGFSHSFPGLPATGPASGPSGR
jgi:hypothetical protein